MSNQDFVDIANIFKEADTNGDQLLSKDEVLACIKNSLEKGLFSKFFSHFDSESGKLAEELFNKYFVVLYEGGLEEVP